MTNHNTLNIEEINCVGATDSIYLASYIDPNKTDQINNIALGVLVSINDQVYGVEDIPDALAANFREEHYLPGFPPQDITIPQSPVPGLVLMSISKVTNITTENIHFTYDARANNPDNALVLLALGPNPTIVETSDFRIMQVCLAPTTSI